MALGKPDPKTSDQSASRASGEAVTSRDKIHTLSSARNWYVDRHQKLVVQRNVLFVLSFVCFVFLGLSVLSVSELNKRKVFEPFVIEVEDKTGIVTQVSHKDIENYTSEDTVVRYFINKYVQSREGYDISSYQYNYYTVVRLLSSEPVFGGFRDLLSTKNEDNPTNLGRSAKRRVRIASLTFLNRKEKVVQLRTVEEDYSLETPLRPYKTKSWLVTLKFNFVDIKLNQDDRFVNPLGFQVVDYSKVPDNMGSN